MPWDIKSEDGRYCVYKKSDNSLEACHDTMAEAKEHMAALYASESGMKKETNVRNILEARIHESFTVAADQLFGNGVIDRPTRINLSGLIGTLLDDFGSAVGTQLEGTPVSDVIARDIMTKETGRTAVWKEKGIWQWMGIVSNNILDEGYPQQNIIAENAHRFMVSAVDSGFYKEIMGVAAPPLWPWHLPIPIGDTLMMAYDERGFVLAAGVGRPGHVNDGIFEGFARARDPIGMSHGAPGWAYGLDEVDRRVITWYLDEELTVAPAVYAANRRTHWVGKYEDTSA